MQVKLQRQEQETTKKQLRDHAVEITIQAESYEQEQKRKKREQVEKYKKHQQAVLDQIEKRAKVLKYLESSIAVSTEFK